MRHITFGGQGQFETAILIKQSAFFESDIQRYYVQPLVNSGYDPKKIIAFSLYYNDRNRVSVKEVKEYLGNLMVALKQLGVKHIYCADSNYFKQLAKSKKSEGFLGYKNQVAIEGYEDMHVYLGINYQALLYDPKVEDKLTMSLRSIETSLKGNYQEPGKDIIKWAHYPNSAAEILEAFKRLHNMPELTCDIETFSLHPFKAGIGTIGFSPNQEGGVAFACDLTYRNGQNVRVYNSWFREQLRKFFESYEGKLYYHKCTFDIKVLIANLWMEHLLDRKGMLRGLHVMYRNCGDTRLIAYLATNSTAGNELGLKDLAHEFAGNWAQSDIKNILLIPLPELLQYNVVDCMSTWYVYNKYYHVMVRDYQKQLYVEHFMPSQKLITQMELVGMPLDPERVKYVKYILSRKASDILVSLRAHPLVRTVERMVQEAAMKKKNSELKTIQKVLSDFKHLRFNPNSNQQVATLLYEVMNLPVVSKTKSGGPSTDGDTLDKLINHTDKPEEKEVLKYLIEFSGVAKILSAFIPAFEDALAKNDGKVYLHGSFLMGGTLSGRLSCSEPNLQQIPSGSAYGKIIKECFSAPDGFLMAGADFNALEDRINALLTQDPNKIKVFTDGYDPHSMRTYAYWPEKFTHLPNTVEGINRIKKEFDPERSASKPVSFALQYLGTFKTLMSNCGFERDEAVRIEENFHKLYAVSGDWVKEQIRLSGERGYGVGAFGLRIRTPLLHKCLMNSRSTLREADAEARSVGNAISGQSYGLLNNRAAVEFMNRVWDSEFKHDIFPIALIHDAIYLLIRTSPKVIKFANDNLIECMAWKDLPEIADPRVPLPAELDIFYPSWANGITLPNNCDEETIVSTIVKGTEEYLAEKKSAKLENK